MPSDLRVAVVHDLRSRGGAWRRLSEQVAALGPGVQVQEFHPEGAEPVTPHAVTVPLPQRAPQAREALRPPLRYLDVLVLARAYQVLGRLVRAHRPDVVWTNPCSLVQTPPLPSALGAPVVYYCDEPRRADYDPDARARTNPRTRLLYAPLRQAQRRLDRAGMAGADVVVTNSRFSAGRIRDAYGREADVVPLGVPDSFTPLDGGPARQHVLSVGTLIPSKGHDLVLRAVGAAGAPLPVVVVSPRPNPAEEERLRSVARGAGVSLTVHVGVSDDRLLDLYRSAVATCYLAQQEPLGLVSLEAQACGSPVVVADEGGLPETLLHERSGWAVPRDPAAAAECLSQLLDPQVHARMSAAAAQHGGGARWSRSGAHMRDVLVRAAAA